MIEIVSGSTSVPMLPRMARTWTRPRKPPSAPARRSTSTATLSVKQASGGSPGDGREAQSIVFFSSAVIELLYSGRRNQKPLMR